MLTVACVEVGDYEGRGDEYVEKLWLMVGRHLRQPFRFVVLTDEPLRHGDCESIQLSDPPRNWWAKAELFRPGRFEGRVLYLDLDSVIVDSLDELVQHKGIIHLDQWGWKQKVYGSGCMVWDAGEHTDIWSRFDESVMLRFRGDQDWMTHLGGWDALPFPLVCSAKYHCKSGPPKGASVVCFHGPVKPHNDRRPWVREAWL